MLAMSSSIHLFLYPGYPYTMIPDVPDPPRTTTTCNSRADHFFFRQTFSLHLPHMSLDPVAAVALGGRHPN